MDLIMWWANLGWRVCCLMLGVALFWAIVRHGPQIWSRLADLIDLVADFIREKIAEKLRKEVVIEDPDPEDKKKGDGAVK